MTDSAKVKKARIEGFGLRGARGSCYTEKNRNEEETT